MRAVLGFVVAMSLAIGGMTTASLVVPELESPALAQNAKPSKKQRSQRGTAPQRTGFEHQQCTVQNPCSTRNQH